MDNPSLEIVDSAANWRGSRISKEMTGLLVTRGYESVDDLINGQGGRRKLSDSRRDGGDVRI